MLSINNDNLSVGTQNVTGAYVINMLVYRLTKRAYMAKQLANNARKTAKAICPRL